VPVFGQIPLALIGVYAYKHAQARQQAERVRRAVAAYLPARALDELTRRVERSRPASELLYGTCLITDAENYTALAERLPPQELHETLNAYYGVLFPEVERCGGFVSDVVGDSMVAIWATPEPDPSARLNACRAAVAILESAAIFNAAHAGFELPTRIGIHSGRILLGDVGTESHFEYRAIGDIVNTASRIQDLNKQLRTTLLVSEDVLAGASQVSYRRLGEFLMAGKELPIRLCDQIRFTKPVDGEESSLIAGFNEAHRLFLDRRWLEASVAFEQLLARFPTDGPSEYFLSQCRRFAAHDPGHTWTGAVAVAPR
jgi:adenylate cyclase